MTKLTILKTAQACAIAAFVMAGTERNAGRGAVGHRVGRRPGAAHYRHTGRALGRGGDAR
jgi:hypothetical protein